MLSLHKDHSIYFRSLMQVEKMVLYYNRCFFAVNNDYFIRTNKANKLMWMTAFCIFTRYIMTNISIFSFFTHLCTLPLSLSTLFLIPYYLTGSQTILQNYLFSWKYINFPLSYFEQKQQIHNYQRRQKMSLTVENVSWSIMFSAGKTITNRIMDTIRSLRVYI